MDLRKIESMRNRIKELEAKLEQVRAIAKKANEGDQYGSTCAWAIHDILEALEGKQDG